MQLAQYAYLIVAALAVLVKAVHLQHRHWISAYDPRWRRHEPVAANVDAYGYYQPANYQALSYQPTGYTQYYMPSVAQQQRAAQSYQRQHLQRTMTPHADLAKHRYEGNYIRRIPGPIPAPAIQQQQQHQPQQAAVYALQPQRRWMESTASQMPVSYSNSVLHVEPEPPTNSLAPTNDDEDYRSRRFTPPPPPPTARVDAIAAEAMARNNLRQASGNDHTAAAAPPPPPQDKASETRYFHDIYMRYNGPHSLSFGHVEDRPEQQSRRFETQRPGQRYKGEVIWADRQGGYGAQQWDLAQGKL